MGFTIVSESAWNYTRVPNLFISSYMPSANGNFVKLYLHLAMVCQHPSPGNELSVPALADCMECTENDILRALHYWQREGLLLLTEEGDEIRCITLCDLPGSDAAAALELVGEDEAFAEEAATATAGARSGSPACFLCRSLHSCTGAPGGPSDTRQAVLYAPSGRGADEGRRD